MSLKLGVERMMLNDVSVYVPQVGCQKKKKREFWNNFEVVVLPDGREWWLWVKGTMMKRWRVGVVLSREINLAKMMEMDGDNEIQTEGGT